MTEIILMTLVVFFTRYLFLEPRLPMRLNRRLEALLQYSSFAVLPAIAAPIVLLEHGQVITSLTHPFLIPSILAILISWRTKNVVLSVGLSMTAMLFLS